MASVRAVKRRGRCSSTDPASLPPDLFHRVLDAVYRRGDVAWEKSRRSYGVPGTDFTAALVSKRWHLASMRALTVARVTAEFQKETDFLKQLTRFKALTKIALYENSVPSLGAKFLKAASKNWPGLRTLVLRNIPTEFSGAESDGAFLRSLTSVVIRLQHEEMFIFFEPNPKSLPRWMSSLANLTNLEVLRSLEVKQLPADFGSSFPKLRRLRLSNVHKLTKLPESMGNLVCLEELILCGCDVDALPASFSRLSALWRLKWDHSEITDLSVIAYLEGLQYLDLRTCTLEDKAPAGLFAGLKLLQVLKLSSSSGLRASSNTTSSPALQSLIHSSGLRVLELRGCERLLGELGWLAELTALRKLEVFSKRVPDLPANIGAPKHLEHACLKKCHFRTLPWSVGDMTSLRYLRIDSSVLEEMPDSLSSLTQLTELSLSGSATFRVASMNFGSITSLRKFRVSGCSLTGIPEDLGLLPHLTSLDVRCAPFNSILPRGFSSLQELYIFGCLYPEVPGLVAKAQVAQLTVEDYPCLKYLRIAFWKADSLPDALGLLHHLEKLELCHGEFIQLPETLTSLSGLRELHVHHCQKLTSLPATLGTTSSLTKLCQEKCDSVDLDSLAGRLKEVKRPCYS